MTQQALNFDGATFEPELDAKRLTTALHRVYLAMRDGRWRTIAQVAELAKCSEAGASARLRDFRKIRVAAVYRNVANMERRRVEGGLHEYRLVIR